VEGVVACPVGRVLCLQAQQTADSGMGFASDPTLRLGLGVFASADRDDPVRLDENHRHRHQCSERRVSAAGTFLERRYWGNQTRGERLGAPDAIDVIDLYIILIHPTSDPTTRYSTLLLPLGFSETHYEVCAHIALF
jgi:hypothetical protein